VERRTGDATAGARLDGELRYLMAQVDEAVEVELARTSALPRLGFCGLSFGSSDASA
jgi:hypothetical protein